MRRCLLLVALAGPLLGCVGEGAPPEVHFGFADGVRRPWLGPDFYANRLQDWRLHDGRAEAVEGRSEKPMRTAHLLTWSLGSEPGSLTISVRTGPLERAAPTADSWGGLLLGVGGDHVDFRISALSHHWPSVDGGMIVAIDATGRIVIRDNSVFQGYRGPAADIPLDAWPEIEPDSAAAEAGDVTDDMELRLQAAPETGGDTYWLDARALDPATGRVVARAVYSGIPAHQLDGNIALASHRSASGAGPGYWFDDLQLGGSKLQHHPERAFGPVMGAFHTVSSGTLKLTAQLAPFGEGDSQTARLELDRGAGWQEAAAATIDPLSATATFAVGGWDDTVAVPYRVAYDLAQGPGAAETFTYGGTIRAAPTDDEFVLAAMNCHHISGGDGQWNHEHFWYPHAETLAGVQYHEPDMVFFAGDQVYESGLEGIVREPLREAALDYLGHWYRFVWAFRDLTRDIPSVMLPDDHDVYHGNIWGAGGIKAEGPRRPFSDNGGYGMDAEWVNAVHRTQVSNLPDPYDPTPIEQDISVYYTSIEYAGISFAVLGDRMFKSSPSVAVPAGDVVNGWAQNPDFDPVTQANVPGAVLLGSRQLRFLDDWAADWSGGDWMKVLLSQTLFANVATLPPDADSGAVLPSLDSPEPDDYPEDYRLAADMDSNGWPQSGRNRALRAIRRAFALHVAGDQHLGSLVHYGVDEFEDAGFGYVVPSIANIWPRRWFPPQPGAAREAGAPRYTGRYLDGFGNRMTVHAVANPVRSGQEPSALYDRTPGYGIVRLRRGSREAVIEAWPRWVDPAVAGARQYVGWPRTVRQLDNYGRAAAAWLPDIRVRGMRDPVIQVIDQATGEIDYTLRISGQRFRPKAFRNRGLYTIRIGEPGTERWREYPDLRAFAEPDTLLVDFETPQGNL